MKTNHTQLLIIGAGPGGYPAAFLAADLGMNVTLIDTKATPGGVCLHQGCIPSKALLHAAKILSQTKSAKEFGIDFGDPNIDITKLRDWKNGIVTKLTTGLGYLCKQRKITFIQGRAAFLNSNTVKIEKPDGSSEDISFDKAILATGSSPKTIPNLPNPKRVLDSTSALTIENIPESMLLVGGGYIGLELGTVYAKLGCNVDVVELLPQIATGADHDLAQILTRQIKSLFTNIFTSTKIITTEDTVNGINVTFEDKNGKSFSHNYEKILVAIGRKPNLENIGLENTKVTLNEQGFVKVNNQCLSADSSIYAIGDITGNPMLAHKASHEGSVAVKNIFGKKTFFNSNNIPSVVFTDPEVAWCGLTETQAKEQNINVKIAKFPWGASGRALTLGRSDGLTKLMVDSKTETILGVAIVGPNAGELIAEGILAIKMNATVSDLKECIHPHPTLSETMMEAAEDFFGTATHIYKPRS